MDVRAESAIRAFRDGVPPPAVGRLTIGRTATLATLETRLDNAAARHGPSPTVLQMAEGDGLSHLLRWAAERASSKGFAVAVLDDVPSSAAPRVLQHALIGSMRLDGLTLIDGLLGRRLEAQPLSVDEVHALISELGRGGITTLTYLLESVRSGNYPEALAVIDWMLGSPADEAWRRGRAYPRVRSWPTALVAWRRRVST